MKICRFEFEGIARYGVMDDEAVKSLVDEPYDELIFDGMTYPISDVRLLAPCEPSKIVAIGKNYAAHAAEMKEGQPDEPLVFLKPNTCVVADGDDVVYPRISKRLDYEGELGVVIGKRAKHVKPGEAHKYIFGYTCLNDVTARDIQKSEPQWTRGKGFDTLCPIGPHIETEIDPSRLAIVTRINGEIRQSSTTDMMTHNIDKLICYITECMTLLPGDIIATGTPEGIGSMQVGDIVEVEIEGIGVLKNTIVKDD
ncbi:MAG: fumarylacetoacetate hydrolase family protein [Clostridia bacterium]|nr:fumarylacetoacetate hydrolase family protein [Clostridia bacterium]